MNSAQQRRERRLTWLIIGLFSLAVSLMALWVFLLHRFNTTVYHPAVGISKASEDELVTKARELRTTWEKWAQAHRDVLIAMRKSNGDPAAFTRAWDELPLLPWHAGFTFNAMSGRTQWSWQPSCKGNGQVHRNPDPKIDNMLTEADASEARHRTHDFAIEKDIALSESGNVGASYICLWASGRITRATVITQNIPGKPVFTDDFTQEEIAPRFDFLP